LTNVSSYWQKALDSIAEEIDVQEFDQEVNSFLKLVENTIKKKGSIYTIACGTSFHATKVAGLSLMILPDKR